MTDGVEILALKIRSLIFFTLASNKNASIASFLVEMIPQWSD
jgi:hypothetical protein